MFEMSGALTKWRLRVLLLAAGASNRFGADKREALFFENESLLMASLGSFRKVIPEVTVCLSAHSRDDGLAAELMAMDCEVHRCKRAAGGMGETLAEASRGNADVDILIVALADMPLISGDTIRSIAVAAKPDRIVLPTRDGSRGHPVAFGRDFFPELGSLTGDRGAASVICRNEAAVIEVATDDAGIHADADTPDALARLQGRLATPAGDDKST